MSHSMRLVFFAFLMLFCGCTEKSSDARPITVGRVSSWLDKNISVGMHVDDVKKFLTTENIEHSWVAKECKIYAIFRDVEKREMTTASITTEFVFDPAMKLENYKVEKVFTGP